MAQVHSSADVDADVLLGAGTQVWHLAQIRAGAQLGAGCVIGRGAYVGPGVVMGRHCKVQNSAQIYDPASLEDGVFVGPAVVFTNDRHPRAVSPDGSPKRGGDWTPVGVSVGAGASIGAGSVCVAPVRVGRWSMVAAGSVVTKDVPDFALVAGVPARRLGWVGRAGVELAHGTGDTWVCPQTGGRYVEQGGHLSEVTR